MQFNNREDIIQMTPLWTGERLPDGRPYVPKETLERLRKMTLEEVWEIPWEKNYNYQFQGGFYQTHYHVPPTVGRAVTLTFVPIREDLEIAMTRQGKAQGMTSSYNQWAVDHLIEDDVLVCDFFDKIDYGTVVGGNLGTVIKKKTIRGGAVTWGGIRDLQQVQAIEGINIFHRGIAPTPIRDHVMTGFNTPCRIGNAICLPGDIVYAFEGGVFFIPAHLAEEIVISGEKIHARDAFGLEKIAEGKYNASEIDTFPWRMEMFEDFMDWLNTSPKAEEYQHLTWDKEREIVEKQLADGFMTRWYGGTVMKRVEDV